MEPKFPRESKFPAYVFGNPTPAQQRAEHRRRVEQRTRILLRVAKEIRHAGRRGW